MRVPFPQSAALPQIGLLKTLRHCKHGISQPAIHCSLSKAIMKPSNSQWTTCRPPSTTLHARSFTYSVSSSSSWQKSLRPCYTSAVTVSTPVAMRYTFLINSRQVWWISVWLRLFTNGIIAESLHLFRNRSACRNLDRHEPSLFFGLHRIYTEPRFLTWRAKGANLGFLSRREARETECEGSNYKS